PVQRQRVGDVQHVLPEVVEAVGTRRGGGGPVPARIDTHDPVVARQRLGLGSPHRAVGAERVQEHDGRGLGWPVDGPGGPHRPSSWSALATARSTNAAAAGVAPSPSPGATTSRVSTARPAASSAAATVWKVTGTANH